MAVSSFRSAIDFFGQVGVYDVILPFLLVFTIMFAILEKTKKEKPPLTDYLYL